MTSVFSSTKVIMPTDLIGPALAAPAQAAIAHVASQMIPRVRKRYATLGLVIFNCILKILWKCENFNVMSAGATLAACESRGLNFRLRFGLCIPRGVRLNYAAAPALRTNRRELPPRASSVASSLIAGPPCSRRHAPGGM